jgi:hypothetical protein
MIINRNIHHVIYIDKGLDQAGPTGLKVCMTWLGEQCEFFMQVMSDIAGTN